jgi:hypothetical protein
MGDLFVTSAEGVSRTIQLILAPVVMISACAIMSGALVSRAAAINDRLRAMTRERLELLKMMAQDKLNRERIGELDLQFPDLLRRLRLTHRAVLFNYAAIFGFILDMLLIALAALTSLTWAALLALIVFLSATITLGLAILVTVSETRMSLNSILFEVERVSRLPLPDPITEPKEVSHEYQPSTK